MTRQMDSAYSVRAEKSGGFKGRNPEESGAFALGSRGYERLSEIPSHDLPDALLRLDDIPALVLGLNELEQVVATNREAREFLGLGEHGWQGQPVQALLNFSCSLREEFRGRDCALHTHQLEMWSNQDSPKPATLTVRRTHSHGPLRYICVISLADGTEVAGATSTDQLAAMGQMIAGFAHEVRNPLAALKSIIEDLSAEPTACESWGKDFTRLNTLVGRIERLVRSSLRLVQPERPNRKEQDGSSLVASAIELLESRMRAIGGGPIEVTCGPERPLVVVDESQIVQVLVILLENALEAASSADHVRVRLHVEPAARSDGGMFPERLVVIDVEDDGAGMSTEILSQIFNPFFTRKPRGTGLGLSIALKLLRENQGRIRVHSSVGKGSVFSVELPVIG